MVLEPIFIDLQSCLLLSASPVGRPDPSDPSRVWKKTAIFFNWIPKPPDVSGSYVRSSRLHPKGLYIVYGAAERRAITLYAFLEERSNPIINITPFYVLT